MSRIAAAGDSRDQGWVLRSVDYRDADRIVALFLREHGLVSVLAKGVRKSKKGLAAALSPFVLLDVRLAGTGHGARRGGAALVGLRQAAIKVPYTAILGNLKAMEVAGRALRMLRDGLPEESPEHGLFEDTQKLFAQLDSAAMPADLAKLERAACAYAFRMLGHLGLAPELEHCGVCGRRARARQTARFDAQLGALRCSRCGVGQLALTGEQRALAISCLSEGWEHALPMPQHGNNSDRENGENGGEDLSALTILVERFSAIHLPRRHSSVCRTNGAERVQDVPSDRATTRPDILEEQRRQAR